MTSSARAAVRGALAVSALMLMTRIWFIVDRAFDVDELEHAHAAWSVAQGLLPYRDFFEHHTPALYVLSAPLFAVLKPETGADSAMRALWASRGVMWVLAIAAAALTFHIGTRWQAESSMLRGALAVCLLTTSWQFLNTSIEFRPDVPAVVCVLTALLCVFEADRGEHRARPAWFAAAGFAFGLSVMFTQKTLFVFPGLLVGAGSTRQPRALFGFLAATALPIAATWGWFATQGAAAAFFDANVAGNVALTADRSSPLPRLLSSALWNLPLYLAGVAGGIAARRAASGPRAALLITAMSLASGIVIIGRVYDQYYLLMLPLLAVLGSDWVLRFAGRFGPLRPVLTLVGTAIAILVAASVSAYQSNDQLVEQMQLVMQRTRADEAILSGVPGAGTFRPHAWYYFFLSGPFASGRDYAALREALEANRVHPRIVIFDARVLAMPATVLDYLRAHYRPVRGDIYERAD